MQPPCTNRRDFLKSITAGSMTFLTVSPLALSACASGRSGKINGRPYRYGVLPVKRLADLAEDFHRMDSAEKLSDHPTFRRYVDNKKDHTLPDEFQDAQSIIVMAVYTPLMFVNFIYQGMAEEIMVPPQYYDDGITPEQLLKTVNQQVIGHTGYRTEQTTCMLMKRLAARTGLTRYGRNNIAYAKGMGSFLTLYAFLTDYDFKRDDWQEVKLLKACEECTLCKDACPNRCIRDENFVIDVSRCTTLYNEVPGAFPETMPEDAHNALMGCMHCQMVCPENQKGFERAGRLEEVTEEETVQILEGRFSEDLKKSLARKLKNYYPATDEKYFPVFTRNLTPLLR